MKTIYFFYFFSILIFSKLNAQLTNFIHLYGPFGCRSRVVEDEAGYLYMPRWYGGIYRSNDYGEHWETIVDQKVSNLSFNHIQSGTDGNLYLEGDAGIIRSKDHGIYYYLLKDSNNRKIAKGKLVVNF